MIVVTQEIFKMFMNQITLKRLDLYGTRSFSNISFPTYPGAIDCLRNLLELKCDSDISSEFFCQISQICHHLLSLEIIIRYKISDGLADLISVQQNLKYLGITNYSGDDNLAEIVPSITNLPNHLTKLSIQKGMYFKPLSFIAKFMNLQELSLIHSSHIDEDLKTLQYVTFPRLRILKFGRKCPNYEYFVKFLENNESNLIKIHLSNIGIDLLNLTVAKFCPNLKFLSTIFRYDEIETLKVILNSCQQLKSIKVWCSSSYYLNEVQCVTKKTGFFNFLYKYLFKLYKILKIYVNF